MDGYNFGRNSDFGSALPGVWFGPSAGLWGLLVFAAAGAISFATIMLSNGFTPASAGV